MRSPLSRLTTGLAPLSTLVVLGCASPTPSPQPTASQPPSALSTVPSRAPIPVTSTTTTAPAPVASGAPPASRGPLQTFYEGLRALERGEREDHVRIIWLGDSHAQADFWTDVIRTGLQKRFGHGGPGFVHLGFKKYRHADIRFDIRGRWRMRPKAPSTVLPWGDGAFGLGGILHAGWADYRSVSMTLEDPALAGKPLRWDLCYKYGLEADAFRLELGEAPPERFSPAKASPTEGAAPIGALTHIERRTQGPARLKVRILAGRPDFCGVVIETDPKEASPGVVLDNLGINGARYATPLAWNEDAWAAEVKRRPAPELFIFEYGGNEASDLVLKPEQYKKNALELIARARRIRPDVSCLVIGPSDRADAEAKIPPIVAALEDAAAQAKCRFWNTYEVMGGRGSLRKWRDADKAALDGIHLKPKGYEEIGALLLQDLMVDYRR